MEDTETSHQKNGELCAGTEHRKDCEIQKNTNKNDVEKISALTSEKSNVRTSHSEDLNNSNNADPKPRIILTLRTSETDPEAYFSTSRIQGKNESRRRDTLPRIRNSTYETAALSPGDVTIPENACKRTLRRMSNSKESVLQNAIALKEKSFGIPESNFQKKSKSPKGNAEKTLVKLPVRMKSPKPNSTLCSERRNFQSTSGVESCKEILIEEDDVDVSYCKSDDSVMNSSSVMVNSNGVYDGNSVSKENNMFNRYVKPMRKRKRYFKGLSYSFNPKRREVKKKKFDRNRGAKYHNYDSSEQDTDSQNTVIMSEEMSEMGGEFAVLQKLDTFCSMYETNRYLLFIDSRTQEVSSASSQSTAVLFKSATKIKQNFNTSLDVLSESIYDNFLNRVNFFQTLNGSC